MYPGVNLSGAIFRYHGPLTSPCPMSIDKACAAALAFTASVPSDSSRCTSKPAVKTTEGRASRAYTHHWQRMLVGRDVNGL